MDFGRLEDWKIGNFLKRSLEELQKKKEKLPTNYHE